MEGLFGGLWAVALIILIVVVAFARRRRRRIGAAASGATAEWETRDRRRAMEIIVEQRAGSRDPEHADGNLPDLEHPTRERRR